MSAFSPKFKSWKMKKRGKQWRNAIVGEKEHPTISSALPSYVKWNVYYEGEGEQKNGLTLGGNFPFKFLFSSLISKARHFFLCAVWSDTYPLRLSPLPPSPLKAWPRYAPGPRAKKGERERESGVILY